MTDIIPYIAPAEWYALPGWKNFVVDLDALLQRLEQLYSKEGFVCFFRLYKPTPGREFVSLGIRPLDLQDSGNPYSILFAFGFFAEPALRWDDAFLIYRVAKSVEAYGDFDLSGALPNDKIDDGATFKNIARSYAFEAGQRVKITQEQLIEAALDGNDAIMQQALEDILS